MPAAFSPPQLKAPVVLCSDFEPTSKSGLQSPLLFPIPIWSWLG